VTDGSEQPSAMTEVFGWLPRYVADRLTSHVHLDERAVAQVRALGEGGTIVYVLRNRSLLDYLLINWLFVREGLPLARFANGVSTGWFLPLIAALRRMSNRLRSYRARSILRSRSISRCSRVECLPQIATG